MTLLNKTIIILIFFALLVALIALLPSYQTYPLPPQLAVSLTIVLGYVFAWSKIFWFLNIWFALALLTMGLEATIWIAKKIIWIIGFVSRLIA